MLASISRVCRNDDSSESIKRPTDEEFNQEHAELIDQLFKAMVRDINRKHWLIYHTDDLLADDAEDPNYSFCSVYVAYNSFWKWWHNADVNALSRQTLRRICKPVLQKFKDINVHIHIHGIKPTIHDHKYFLSFTVIKSTDQNALVNMHARFVCHDNQWFCWDKDACSLKLP